MYCQRLNFVDPSVINLKQTFTPPLKLGVATTISFKVSISNLAIAKSWNNIKAVTGTDTNFDVRLRFSNNDMSTGLNTLTLAEIIPSISLADLQQKLDADGGIIDIPGSALLTVPIAECNQIKYLCATTTTGTGANYTDANTANNVACESIIGQRTCEPGKQLNPLTFFNMCPRWLPLLGGQSVPEGSRNPVVCV